MRRREAWIASWREAVLSGEASEAVARRAIREREHEIRLFYASLAAENRR